MNYKIDNINNYTEEHFKAMYLKMPKFIKNKIDHKALIENKKQTTLGYYLLKELLKSCYNLYNIPEIILNENGKPLFKDKNIYFNISHCEELVVCAVSSKNIGIDIEKIKSKNKSLINYICNEEELKQIETSINKEKKFIETWTKKESYIKYLGSSININIKNILNDVNNNYFTTSIINEKDGQFVLTIYQETEKVKL